jgi:hypothetical protein
MKSFTTKFYFNFFEFEKVGFGLNQHQMILNSFWIFNLIKTRLHQSSFPLIVVWFLRPPHQGRCPGQAPLLPHKPRAPCLPPLPSCWPGLLPFSLVGPQCPLSICAIFSMLHASLRRSSRSGHLASGCPSKPPRAGTVSLLHPIHPADFARSAPIFGFPHLGPHCHLSTPATPASTALRQPLPSELSCCATVELSPERRLAL